MWCMVVNMTVRMSISLPEDLHAQVVRIAESSHVSVASTVRAILADVLPRMTSVLDYLGTAPTITQAEVSEADAWLRDLRALYERAPATYRDAVGEIKFDAPPSSDGHD